MIKVSKLCSFSTAEVILGRPNYVDAPKPFDDPGWAKTWGWSGWSGWSPATIGSLLCSLIFKGPSQKPHKLISWQRISGKLDSHGYSRWVRSVREKSLGTQLYEWLLPFRDRPLDLAKLAGGVPMNPTKTTGFASHVTNLRGDECPLTAGLGWSSLEFL
jgi:hypothetical protein